MKVVTVAQMVAIEQASEKAGVSTDVLMENAGLAFAECARDIVGAAGVRIVVLVGPGNNGSDGLVAARHLRRWGAEVTCFLVAGRPEVDPKLDLAIEYGVQFVDCVPETVKIMLGSSDLIIDAILGTGRSRPLEGNVLEIMLSLAAARKELTHPKLLALDLPTGLDADTGHVDHNAVPCDYTFALGYPKLGLFKFPGAEHAGAIRVLDIGIPDGLNEDKAIQVEALDASWVACRLPVRQLDSHKGTFGHALVIAGSRNYVGAAYLASQACVRSGAGLTTLASPESVYPIVAAKSTEPINLPLSEDAEGMVESGSTQIIREGPRRYTNVLVGCGLGLSEGTVHFLEDLLFKRDCSGMFELPTIVDADGLNSLARIENWAERGRGSLVLTPHPGEMATLSGLSVAEIQQDRMAVAREYSARWNVTLVLKGANTVIAQHDGMTWVSPFANPGLATGGTGDVLSGIIAGLMAQGLDPVVAATCGVYLHGDAGREIVSTLGNIGIAASDLIPQIPLALRRIMGA